MGWRYLFLSILTVLIVAGIYFQQRTPHFEVSHHIAVPIRTKSVIQPAHKPTAAPTAAPARKLDVQRAFASQTPAGTNDQADNEDMRDPAAPDPIDIDAITKELQGADRIVLQEVPGTWHLVNENEDGSYQAEYESSDGSLVREWYSADKQLEIEEVMYDDSSKMTRWYAPGTNRISTVQYDNGDNGGLVQYRDNNQADHMRFWHGDEPEQRVDF
jgi:hypothetical protein